MNPRFGRRLLACSVGAAENAGMERFSLRYFLFEITLIVVALGFWRIALISFLPSAIHMLLFLMTTGGAVGGLSGRPSFILLGAFSLPVMLFGGAFLIGQWPCLLNLMLPGVVIAFAALVTTAIVRICFRLAKAPAPGDAANSN